MCRLQNIALESVTEKCDRRTDRQKTDKVMPMCRYALQATQKLQQASSQNWSPQAFALIGSKIKLKVME